VSSSIPREESPLDRGERAAPLDPQSRLLVVVASFVGIVAAQSLCLLIGFLCVAWGLMAWGGQLSIGLKRMGGVALPLVPALFLVWGLLVPMDSRTAGLLFASITSLKIVAASSLAFAAFGALTPDELAQQLRAWGLGHQAVSAGLGALTIWPEMRMRAMHIVEARRARGLLPRSSLLPAVASLPFVLRSLLTWSLRSAILRAESLERRGLVARIGDRPVATAPRWRGAVLALGAVAWATAAVWMRLNP
jgi:energy-coupling factor transporter transmembrane protein EcfT